MTRYNKVSQDYFGAGPSLVCIRTRYISSRRAHAAEMLAAAIAAVSLIDPIGSPIRIRADP
jgi:hypothetical protein